MSLLWWIGFPIQLQYLLLMKHFMGEIMEKKITFFSSLLITPFLLRVRTSKAKSWKLIENVFEFDFKARVNILWFSKFLLISQRQVKDVFFLLFWNKQCKTFIIPKSLTKLEYFAVVEEVKEINCLVSWREKVFRVDRISKRILSKVFDLNVLVFKSLS